MMYQRFSWRGEPIADIHKWAKDRGERMVRYKAERDYPSAITLRIEHEECEGEMPQSFWDGHVQFDGLTGWHYRELTVI